MVMIARQPTPKPLPSHPDVEFFGSEIAHSRHLQVEIVRFRHRCFSGEWSNECAFDVVRRGSAVAIVLYDPERDCVVLVEQFRLAALLAGCSPWQIEPVGGMVDRGETPTEAAIRETGEESGLELIGDPVPIQRYLPSPSAFDECLHLFCGRVDSGVAAGLHGRADEQEHIKVVVKPIAEIEQMVEMGAVESCHTLVSLHWLLRNRERLRSRWGMDGALL
jgi:ADP-ribose pyrophosphatase